MGDVIQFRDYGTRPARPNNTKADRAFWMGRTERQGRGYYLASSPLDAFSGQELRDLVDLAANTSEGLGSGRRYPDDLVMPCADPGIAGMDWISDTGDECA